MNNLEPIEELLKRMQKQVDNSYAELHDAKDRAILLEVRHEADKSFLFALETAIRVAKGEI